MAALCMRAPVAKCTAVGKDGTREKAPILRAECAVTRQSTLVPSFQQLESEVVKAGLGLMGRLSGAGVSREGSFLLPLRQKNCSQSVV